MTVAEAVDVLPRRMADWTARLSIAPNSMTGISLALGLCAAVWFTAGTRPGNVIGALALCGSYLAGRSARGLGIPVPGGAGTAVTGMAGVAAAAGAKAAGSRAAAVSEGRLARACAVVIQCGVYACLAAGSVAAGGVAAGSVAAGGRAGQIGMWQLATTVVIVVAVSQLAGACGSVPPAREQRESQAGGLTWRAVTWRVLAFPYGGQVLLIAIAAPVWGARAALFGLLGWAVVAIGYALVAGRPQPAGNTGIQPARACRDDGLIASGLGFPIRGQLVPLPPALTGLAAVCVLAVLGLRSLPGVVLLAPVVAMLLAAVGSSHQHDGRLDWIVPVVLQAGQYVYIAAIGFASGVPAPVIYALCALIAVHYADLARHAQRHTALGWDGRMIVAGLGAALGIATFAYLLLAAYVGVLICREVRTSWLAAMEGDRR